MWRFTGEYGDEVWFAETLACPDAMTPSKSSPVVHLYPDRQVPNFLSFVEPADIIHPALNRRLSPAA